MQFDTTVVLFAALAAGLDVNRRAYDATPHLNVDSFQASCDPKALTCQYQFGLFNPGNFGTSKGADKCAKTIQTKGDTQLPAVTDVTCSSADTTFSVAQNGDGSLTLSATSASWGTGQRMVVTASRVIKSGELSTDKNTGGQTYTSDKDFAMQGQVVS